MTSKDSLNDQSSACVADGCRVVAVRVDGEGAIAGGTAAGAMIVAAMIVRAEAGRTVAVATFAQGCRVKCTHLRASCGGQGDMHEAGRRITGIGPDWIGPDLRRATNSPASSKGEKGSIRANASGPKRSVRMTGKAVRFALLFISHGGRAEDHGDH